MFRVSFMEKNPDFENFDKVWARVTEAADFEVPDITSEIKSEEKLCILPKSEKSRAVRFIPDI